MLFGGKGDPVDVVIALTYASTILTPVWTLGILGSAILVRGAMTLRYPMSIITWLFDIDEHPIEIIGIMLAGLAWAGAVIYSLL
jgi:hypothetical protein